MISQVTIKISGHSGDRDIWFLFDSQHKNLSEMYEDLANNGVIYGHRIETKAKSAGSDQRRPIDRDECIISRSAIVTIRPSKIELVSK